MDKSRSLTGRYPAILLAVVLTAGATAAIVWLVRTPRVAVSSAMQKVLQKGSSEEVLRGPLPADLDTGPPPA